MTVPGDTMLAVHPDTGVTPFIITGGHTDMHAEVVEVTPQLAEKWIATNHNNRRIRQRSVDAYARDIANGNWAMNGESLKFDKDGELIDGQHRLLAVVKADKPVNMLVVYDVADEAKPTIDMGIKRQYADVLKMRGTFSQTNLLAAVTRRVYLWEVGERFNTKVVPTASDLDETMREYPEVEAAAIMAHRWNNGQNMTLTGSTFGLLFFLFARIDADQAEWFLSRVSDGAELPTSHPAIALRNRVLQDRLRGKRLPGWEQTALGIRAWNAYRRGQRLTRMQTPVGGWTTRNYPEPI